jgi:hypothetical protein
MSSVWSIKPDKRFRKGNIKVKDGEFRGHPDTVQMNHYQLPPKPDTSVTNIDHLKFQLAPPIVVSHELGETLRKQLHGNL